MSALFMSTFDKALSDHQINAMRDEVHEDDSNGFILDVTHVHGNAVRGLARHGLVVVSSGTFARLTPIGVRLHAVLTERDPEELLAVHSSHFDTPSDLALHAAGL